MLTQYKHKENSLKYKKTNMLKKENFKKYIQKYTPIVSHALSKL